MYLGGGDEDEDDGVVCTGRETVSEEPASGMALGIERQQSLENLSHLSEEKPIEKPKHVRQLSNRAINT